MKLNGKPVKLSVLTRSPQVLARTLDGYGKDEVFTVPELARRCGIDRRTLSDWAKKLPGYTLRIGATRYWGHRVAVKELSRQSGISL